MLAFPHTMGSLAEPERRKIFFWKIIFREQASFYAFFQNLKRPGQVLDI